MSRTLAPPAAVLLQKHTAGQKKKESCLIESVRERVYKKNKQTVHEQRIGVLAGERGSTCVLRYTEICATQIRESEA